MLECLLAVILEGHELLGEVASGHGGRLMDQDVAWALGKLASFTDDLVALEGYHSYHASFAITARLRPQALLGQLLLDVPQERLVLFTAVCRALRGVVDEVIWLRQVGRTVTTIRRVTIIILARLGLFEVDIRNGGRLVAFSSRIGGFHDYFGRLRALMAQN